MVKFPLHIIYHHVYHSLDQLSTPAVAGIIGGAGVLIILIVLVLAMVLYNTRKGLLICCPFNDNTLTLKYYFTLQLRL